MGSSRNSITKKTGKSEKTEKPITASLNINPKESVNNLIDGASNIVFKAANILEEEIAKGIIAAKKVEEKFTDVSKLRRPSNSDLFSRFRKDAHDIIDLLVDASEVAAGRVGKLTSQFMNIKQDAPKETKGESASFQSHVPLIYVPKELKPKEVFEVPITLENDSQSEAKTILFENTALVDANNNQLAASSISYSPNPLILEAGKGGTIQIKITVPANAKPGSYSAFLQGKNISNLKATLVLNVIQ